MTTEAATEKANHDALLRLISESEAHTTNIIAVLERNGGDNRALAEAQQALADGHRLLKRSIAKPEEA